MQLKLNRSSFEKKGMFGSKTIYKLEALVDPTDAERSLMLKNFNLQYLALGMALHQGRSDDFSADLAERRAMDYAIIGDHGTENFVKRGLTLESADAAVIQEAEAGITAACKAIKVQCQADESFASGTERIIDL